MTPSDRPAIRAARVDEIPALVELQRQASLIWDAYRADLLAHPEVMAIPTAQVRTGGVRVVVDEDDRPLGFSAVIEHEEAVELDGLFVAPEHMRRGLGGRLIADAVARARATGARRIEVTANLGAVPFYERLGFRQVGMTQTRFGPAPRYRLSLTP